MGPERTTGESSVTLKMQKSEVAPYWPSASPPA